MAKIGRPTTYTQELADTICAELALGKPLRTVCLIDGMPQAPTIFKWIREIEEFAKQYARAKEEATDAMAEEILAISDETDEGQVITEKGDGTTEIKREDMLGHRKLRIETRKWLMAKMKPKRYGDKMDMTTNGESLNIQVLPNAGHDPKNEK